ncbi:MAG: phosphatidate cytidylyltransferase [Candidatus Kaelpia imicola]|nr:phosphatidate cytidylyltransferase [Candidatus Kaelpia imicola]
MDLFDRNLVKRIISSIVIILFIFWVIIFANLFIYTSLIVMLATVALWEFYRIIAKRYGSIYPGIGFIVSYLLFAVSLKENLGFAYLVYPLSFALILLFLYQMVRKTNKDAALCLGLTMLGLIYITIPAIFLIKIRMLQGGISLVIYYICVIKATDIGAYLVGVKFGRHPLIPRISPKKSIEGFIGGIMFAISVSCAASIYWGVMSFYHAFTVGFILGVCAQFGDLSESVLKRDAGVKDSGKTIPGLGGVLDLSDSILIALPFYYIYMHNFIIK